MAADTQKLMVINMMNAMIFWKRRTKWSDFWFLANMMALIFIPADAIGQLRLPDFNGLNQQFAFLGMYIWMLVVVLEIELKRREVESKTETR